MTRSQLMLAGKLWGLSLIANTQPEIDDPDELKVARNANVRARSALHRLGSDVTNILTAADAIDEAKRLRPTP